MPADIENRILPSQRWLENLPMRPVFDMQAPAISLEQWNEQGREKRAVKTRRERMTTFIDTRGEAESVPGSWNERDGDSDEDGNRDSDTDSDTDSDIDSDVNDVHLNTLKATVLVFEVSRSLL